MSNKNYIDYVLSDHFYEFQQDNWNPDGTSNMVFNKTYGRFNQCATSSDTMCLNQALTRMRSKGIVPLDSFKKSLFDEIALNAVLLGMLNDGDAFKHNPDRYLWSNHLKLLNMLLKNSFKGKLPGSFVQEKVSVTKIINVLKSNYQPIVGIWIKKYWPTGEGHVTTVVGWREENTTKKVLGLMFNDPAGNILKKGSYKNAAEFDGKEVFYPIDIITNDLFIKDRQMIYFRET